MFETGFFFGGGGGGSVLVFKSWIRFFSCPNLDSYFCPGSDPYFVEDQLRSIPTRICFRELDPFFSDPKLNLYFSLEGRIRIRSISSPGPAAQQKAVPGSQLRIIYPWKKPG